MTFDVFKKNFFPQFCFADEDNQSEGEKAAHRTKQQIRTNASQQPRLIKERITKIEQLLKHKFGNNFESVRDAFLKLDADHDALISCEDILRQFTPEDNIDYFDLKKLMQDKDSKHIGTLDY
jgi:hypothetical protein